MVHMFTGIGKTASETTPGTSRKSINVHALIGKTVLVIFFLIILGYALFNLVGFAMRISANWQEIQFAYDKPAVVKAVRTQYQSKATALDSQFEQGKPSEEAQVLKEVKAALAVPSK